MNIEITSLSSSHVNTVVEIHLRAFPNFFLSFLGPRFLREFYGSFLVDSQGVGFIALSSAGQILGVIVGPVDPRGYFKRLLKRRWWKFCVASIAAGDWCCVLLSVCFSVLSYGDKRIGVNTCPF